MPPNATPVPEPRPKDWRDELRVWAVVLSATFCLAAVGRNIWAWYGPPSWKPRIECAAGTFNFGERRVGEMVEHEFLLVNTGRQDLIIQDVEADCQCVTVRLAQGTIPPGYSLAIPLLVSLRDRSSGVLTQRLAVQSNDPDVPILRLTVTGRVLDSIERDAEKQ